MALKITAQVVGGEAKTFESVGTVRDVMGRLGISENYKASVRGEPVELDEELEDYDFVSFSENVKGGK